MSKKKIESKPVSAELTSPQGLDDAACSAPRWGRETRGKGPWKRMQRKDLGWGHDGYRNYSEPQCVEESMNYDELWQSGDDDWRDNGRASTIVDSEGVTCMIFD